MSKVYLARPVTFSGPSRRGCRALHDAELRVQVPGLEIALGGVDLERLRAAGEAGLDVCLTVGRGLGLVRRLLSHGLPPLRRPAWPALAAFWTASKIAAVGAAAAQVAGEAVP